MSWLLKIELETNSFAELKFLANQVFDKIASAKSHRDLSIAGGGGSSTGYISRYVVTCICPIGERIKQLRKEADELEASLQNE